MSPPPFKLPPTANDHPPAFLSVLACQDWLASVPLANSGQAQVMLLRQINLLNNFRLPASERLALMELLRQTVIDVQDDVAKKFACKALPLTPPEQTALDGTLALWNAVLGGYLRLLEDEKQEPALARERARIAQRALTIFADWQVDLYRGALLPDENFWRLLYQVFAVTEALGVLVEPVDDGPRHGSTATSALAAFAESVLLYTANTYELSPRQLNWVARWSRRWGAKLGLLRSPPTAIGDRALPLFLDLKSTRPPSYFAKDAGEGRWLETTALRKSLKSRITLLEQGEQPSRLHMGEDCTQPAAGQLLQRVYQRWCKGGIPRRQERKSTAGSCDFIIGLPAIHYYLSGHQPFKSPTIDERMLREEREALAVFGERARRKPDNYSEQQGFELENWAQLDDWQLFDQSANGLRLNRPLKGGVRVGSGHIVAVKLAGSSNFVLGSVRWALQTPAFEDANGQHTATLSAGIELYPGVAQPVAVRAADPGLRDSYRQAMKLPAIPALGVEASLILPAGTFRVARPIELWVDGATTPLQLKNVLDRTSDFERCTFSARP